MTFASHFLTSVPIFSRATPLVTGSLSSYLEKPLAQFPVILALDEDSTFSELTDGVFSLVFYFRLYDLEEIKIGDLLLFHLVERFFYLLSKNPSIIVH